MNMEGIKELYKIGRGPSSSHTLAPERACNLFTSVNGTFPYYEVELFGSLSLTGRGHFTDRVIKETLPGEVNIIFLNEIDEDFPNGFYLKALNKDKECILKWTIYSIGGGSIRIKEYKTYDNDEIYKEKSFKEISEYVENNKISLLDYIYGYEPDLKAYLNSIFEAMIDCVDNGLNTKGILPGLLKLERTAHELYKEALSEEDNDDLKMMAYAYAACEENADGKTCVTAPTLGSCGVMASMVYYAYKDKKIDKEKIINALAIGGLFGNLIKSNATISGAVGGCQAEVGAAVSMASASFAYLMDMDINQIEYAAEIGMEHNLGLTCDPVLGYVMIPCIERNAMGILRAYDAAILSKHMSKIKGHLVSFDMVVDTMNETGKQIPIALKETSMGGLAKEFENEKK